MQYNKINNLLGWLCFAIASITYILTLEPSVSFWDCGEFISCAYRLQVAHQPGYPLFAMLGKAFSLLSFGDRTKVPYFTNMGSALASSVSFFLLSNFAVWAAHDMYPKNFSGLMTCYAMAVPFFRGTLAGDLVFTAVLFAVPVVIKQFSERGSQSRGAAAA